MKINQTRIRTRPLLRLWLVLTVVRGTVAAPPASFAQTAWIYLKRQDGKVEKKIVANVPPGADVRYETTTFISRDTRGQTENLVAWVPFMPIIAPSPREFPHLPELAKQQLERI